MSKYLLSRKEIDLLVIEWEKLHDSNEQKVSLPMFIRNKQSLHMAQKLFDEGLIGKVILWEIRTKAGMINKDSA